MNNTKLSNANEFIDSIIEEKNLSDSEEFRYYSILGEISSKIVDYRIEKELSQEQLADLLHVSQVMVSRYESGDYNISIQKLNHICHVLGLRLDVSISNLQEMEYSSPSFPVPESSPQYLEGVPLSPIVHGDSSSELDNIA